MALLRLPPRMMTCLLVWPHQRQRLLRQKSGDAGDLHPLLILIGRSLWTSRPAWQADGALLLTEPKLRLGNWRDAHLDGPGASASSETVKDDVDASILHAARCAQMGDWRGSFEGAAKTFTTFLFLHHLPLPSPQNQQTPLTR